jgi:hypothetical protein
MADTVRQIDTISNLNVIESQDAELSKTDSY